MDISLNNKPLVVILGPTASGKTSVSLDLAEMLDGEIICADSRTVYKGLDIGTAKPTPKEQSRVTHWGLDLVNPGEYFSVADFKKYVLEKINDIRSRGKTPFLVGGTGLYIDSIIFDYQFGDKADIELREKLNKLSIQELQNYCNENNVKLPENSSNKRYIIRNIEKYNSNVSKKSCPIDNTIIIGIKTDRDVLRDRIKLRTEQIFSDESIKEAVLAGNRFGWDNEALKGNVYPLIRLYLEDRSQLDYLKEKNSTLDWRLAKRQMTWFKRNPYINWMSLDEVKDFTLKAIAKLDKDVLL